jgi:hypothetical protein
MIILTNVRNAQLIIILAQAVTQRPIGRRKQRRVFTTVYQELLGEYCTFRDPEKSKLSGGRYGAVQQQRHISR